MVISACFDAFNERRALTTDDLLHEIGNTVPLSVTQAEQIAALRAWADIRAVAASAPEDREGYATPDPATPRRRYRPRLCWPGEAGPSRPERGGLQPWSTASRSAL